MNAHFHTLIVEAAQNHAVNAAPGPNDMIPVVSSAIWVFDHAAREQQYRTGCIRTRIAGTMPSARCSMAKAHAWRPS
ncbi:MAG TPA: hypothetical protein VJS30_15350 [Paraburkholderia sp.]|nr:hypothetical protein [Paraburkholderia sp.]